MTPLARSGRIFDKMARVELPHLFAIAKRGGRKGDRRLWYFQRRGYKDPISRASITRIPGRPGEAAFDAAYRRTADESERQRHARGEPEWPAEGSLAQLIARYRGDGALRIEPSAKWRRLAPRTQRDYSRILDKLAARFGRLAVKGLDRPTGDRLWEGKQFVSRLQDSLAKTPREADHMITTLRILLNYAVKRGELVANVDSRIMQRGKPARGAAPAGDDR